MFQLDYTQIPISLLIIEFYRQSYRIPLYNRYTGSIQVNCIRQGNILAAVLVIVILAIVIGAAYHYQSNQDALARKAAREKEEAERKRVEDCKDVVRYFANYHGYIARSAINREELETAIDSGASADQLWDLIIGRIDGVDGMQLGYHKAGSGRFPVILPQEYRDKHVYVIGKSGYGKTNFLRYLIRQDMHNGEGVGVLAPEHEMLADELLPFIPEHRVKDVIYFNPADLERPVVLNPLHIESGDDIDLHVDEAFTILQRVVGEGGPRMDEILRHSLYALMERRGSTLLDMERLLDRNDDSFRKEVLHETEDERTARFFNQIYPQMPKDAHLPILNRIGRMVRSKYARNCLCPPTRTPFSEKEVSGRLLNIRQAMDESRIILFNLSDGLLGEAASQLIGQFIVSKFQTATMSRADEPKMLRVPFYLYLDEFQNFCGIASQSYERLLSRARKYRLGLILAHQQTGQLPLELLKEIFGNVSTMVSFQVAQSDAGKLSKEFINQYDFDIENIPVEELLRLNVGEAYCKIGMNSFAMRVPLMDEPPDWERAREVMEQSRMRYGIPRTISQAKQIEASNPKTEDPLADLDPDEVF